MIIVLVRDRGFCSFLFIIVAVIAVIIVVVAAVVIVVAMVVGAAAVTYCVFVQIAFVSCGRDGLVYTAAHGNPHTFLSAFSWVHLLRFLIAIRRKKTR